MEDRLDALFAVTGGSFTSVDGTLTIHDVAPLTVFFADDKVARYENQGVPTQSDLDQVERDLRKAIAETKAKREKPSLWKRMFGHGKNSDTTSASAPSDSKTSKPATAGEKPPDPVPAPASPVPAGTPSGPT